MLQFAAMIRLPDEMSKEDKMLQLQSVIDALDLNKCLNTSKSTLHTFILNFDTVPDLILHNHTVSEK